MALPQKRCVPSASIYEQEVPYSYSSAPGMGKSILGTTSRMGAPWLVIALTYCIIEIFPYNNEEDWAARARAWAAAKSGTENHHTQPHFTPTGRADGHNYAYYDHYQQTFNAQPDMEQHSRPQSSIQHLPITSSGSSSYNTGYRTGDKAIASDRDHMASRQKRGVPSASRRYLIVILLLQVCYPRSSCSVAYSGAALEVEFPQGIQLSWTSDSNKEPASGIWGFLSSILQS